MSELNLMAQAYAALEKYPLYDFAQEGQIDVLVVGDGQNAAALMDAIISVGQMNGRKLTVHCPFGCMEERDQFRKNLLERAPMLECFSDLVQKREDALVFFSLPVVKMDEGAEKAAQAVLEACEGVCYAVVDLEDEEKTAAMAVALANGMRLRYKKSVVLCAANAEAEGVVRMKEMDDDIKERLIDTACRVDFEYQRFLNPGANRKQCRETLLNPRDTYNLQNSMATVLHGYRLACFGMQDMPIEQAAQEYAKHVIDDEQNRAIATDAEHKRWMMNLVMRGVVQATDDELRKHCFNGDGNNRFRFKTADDVMHHNCMVMSDVHPNHRRLYQEQREVWDQYASIDEIEKDPNFDDLDKVSLRCHLLAKEILNGWLKEKESMLHDLEQMTKTDADRIVYGRFSEWYTETLSGQGTFMDSHPIDELADRYGEVELIRRFRAGAASAREYYSYRDYKLSDMANIDSWIMIDTSRLALIKLSSARAIDMVAPVLLLDPVRVCYMMREDEGIHLREFLRGRGENEEVVFYDEHENPVKIALELFEKGYQPVIDITGAQELQVAQVCALVQSEDKIGVVWCDTEKQRMHNVSNFPAAEAQRRKVHLSAEEVLSLARSVKKSVIERNFSIRSIRRAANKVLPFYEENKAKWKRTVELLRPFLVTTANCIINIKKEKVLEYRNKQGEFINWQAENVSEKAFGRVSTLLYSLIDMGIVKDLRYEESRNVKMQIPAELNDNVGKLFEKARKNMYFNPCIYSSDTSIAIADANMDRFECCWAQDRMSAEGWHSVEKTMQWLEDKGLIDSLELGERFCNFRIIETGLALLLMRAGNMLEAIVLDKVASGAKDVDLCFSQEIGWQDYEQELLCNEVDLLCISGMQATVFSCKDTSPKRGDVHDIRITANCLDDQARAVIVSSIPVEINPTTGRRMTENLEARCRQSGVELVLWDDVYKKLEEISREMTTK